MAEIELNSEKPTAKQQSTMDDKAVKLEDQKDASYQPGAPDLTIEDNASGQTESAEAEEKEGSLRDYFVSASCETS